MGAFRARDKGPLSPGDIMSADVGERRAEGWTKGPLVLPPAEGTGASWAAPEYM